MQCVQNSPHKQVLPKEQKVKGWVSLQLWNSSMCSRVFQEKFLENLDEVFILQIKDGKYNFYNLKMRTNYSLFLCLLLATCTLQAIIVTNSLPSIVKINSNQYIISIESSNVLADPTQQQSTIKQTAVAQESTSTSKTVSSSGESQLQSILSSLTSVPIKIASSGPSSTAITVDSSSLYDTTTQQQQSTSDSSVKPVAAQKTLYPGIPNIVASAPTPVSITSSTPKVGLGNIATTPTITTTAPTSTAPIIGLANPTMTSK